MVGTRWRRRGKGGAGGGGPTRGTRHMPAGARCCRKVCIQGERKRNEGTVVKVEKDEKKSRKVRAREMENNEEGQK